MPHWGKLYRGEIMIDKKLREILTDARESESKPTDNDLNELIEEYKHKFCLLTEEQANIIRPKMAMNIQVCEQRKFVLEAFESKGVACDEIIKVFDLYQTSVFMNMATAIDMFIYGDRVSEIVEDVKNLKSQEKC